MWLEAGLASGRVSGAELREVWGQWDVQVPIDHYKYFGFYS